MKKNNLAVVLEKFKDGEELPLKILNELKETADYDEKLLDTLLKLELPNS